MKIRVSDLKSGTAYENTENIEFGVEQYQHVFSLRRINETTVKAVAKNYGEIIEVRLNILSKLILACSYSLEDVNYTLKTEDIIEFSVNEISDDIIQISGNVIDLDEFVLSIIIAGIPLRVKKPGAKPIVVPGIKVVKEDEFIKEEEEKTDPRLKLLDDWDE